MLANNWLGSVKYNCIEKSMKERNSHFLQIFLTVQYYNIIVSYLESYDYR